MSWIKISDDDGGVWADEALPDPKRIVKVVELLMEIEELQNNIDAISLLEYPQGASDNLREAIDNWNNEKSSYLNGYILELADKKEILKQINGNNSN